MNNLLLMRLKLTKFKGVDLLIIEPKGKDISICGANRLGKTTTGDGLTWLLFDKDMQGRAKFNLKTLDGKAKEIGHIDHSVEGSFLYNGEGITLKKILTENHTKKRGEAKKSFTGNVTEYYIDGLKTTQGKYKALIADITDEQTFRLLTMPFFFAEGLKWEKRREIVINICGDISDGDIIAGSKKLAALPGILNDKPAEEYMNHLKSQRKTVNEQLDKIPTQIEENSRSLPDLIGCDQKVDAKSLVEIGSTIITKEKALAGADVGGASVELNNELVEIKGKIADHERKAADDLAEKIREKKGDHSDRESAIKSMEGVVETLKSSQRTKQNQADASKAELDRMDEEYDLLKTTPCGVVDGMSCDLCTQEVPKEVQESVHGAIRNGKMNDLNSTGAVVTENRKSYLMQVENIGADISEKNIEIGVAQSELSTCTGELKSLEEAPAETTGAHMSDLSEKERIEDRIAKAGDGDTTELKAEIEAELKELRDNRDTVQGRLDLVASHAKVEERNVELKKEEDELAVDFDRIERELMLIEEFIKAKVYSLGVKVKEHFGDIEFQMFEQAINGGVKPCCSVLVRDSKALVPFSSANTAGQINTGIKIMSVLSKHYDVQLPIVIDRAESVVDFEPTDSQMIKLVVTKDPELVFNA